MKLFKRLIKDSKINWEKYINHEFVEKISNGTLEKENFHKYLNQDYYYLFIYAKIFSSLSLHAKNWKQLKFIIKSLVSIIEEQKELDSIYSHLTLDTNKFKINKSCLEYTKYLQEISDNGDYLDILIALSPCFIGYYMAAIKLNKSVDIPDEYSKWIDKYSGLDYKDSVDEIIEHINEFSNISDYKYERIQKIFNDVSFLEYKFFSENL